MTVLQVYHCVVLLQVGSIWFTEFKRTVEEDADLLNKLIDVETQLSGVVDVIAPADILITKTNLSAMVGGWIYCKCGRVLLVNKVVIN